MPEAIVIGGANGAGKTTFARELLPALYPAVAFLNTDEVQTESSAFAHPVAAGRELLRRLADMERRRESFALETTLSSTMYVRRIRAWRTWGYHVSLHFIELPPEGAPEGGAHGRGGVDITARHSAVGAPGQRP